MSNEVDFLQEFFQSAIDKIVSNLSTMEDSKGHNRFASGVTAQEVGQEDAIVIKDYVDKWIVQIYMPNYYAYIDEGVSGWKNEKKNTGKFKYKKNGHPIPLKVIRSFMMNRGIVYQGFHGDKKKPKSKQTVNDKLNQLAWVIGRSIKKKGTEGVPFYSSVINDDFLKSLQTNFLNVYGDKILDEVATIFKKQN
jgi:hypothetical protein